ncbi:MAG: PKD domain-containing protein [Actinomycetes bacterium]
MLALVALAGIVTFIRQSPPTAASDGVRPNIVVIEADDLRADELQFLPKTRELLQGTTFTNSFASTSLCCPSRAAFLSGQYATNNGVADNYSFDSFDANSTIATLLHDSGYFTGIIGKYLNGYECDTPRPPGWNQWQVLCGGAGSLYRMQNYTMNINGSTTKMTPQIGALYQTDEIAKRSTAVIEEGANSSNPFFLWITPTANHSGPGTRYRPVDRTAIVPCTRTRVTDCWRWTPSPNYGEPDVTDKPNYLQPLPPLVGSRVAGRARNVIVAAELKRLRMLPALDELVASVVAKLKSLGQFDNTIIMFTSDNGYMLGEHRYFLTKGLVYDESLRVPLIVSGPGVPVATNPAPIVNTDLAPTIAHFAGLEAQDQLVFDGRSFIPALDDPSINAHRAMLHTQVEGHSTGRMIGLPTISYAQPAGIAVRADQFIYIELATGERELYDHSRDPYELTNEADNPTYATVRGQLASLLSELSRCRGATCHRSRANLRPNVAVSSICLPDLSCVLSIDASDPDGAIGMTRVDFGDGAVVETTSATIPHAYATRGSKVVSVAVLDDRGEPTTITDTLTVGPPNVSPIAAFAASPTDLSVAFDGTPSSDPDGSVVSWSWDFGDGTGDTGSMPAHTYTQGGSYSVAMTVTDNEGTSTTLVRTVLVQAPNVPPTAVWTPAVVGRTVAFTGSDSFDPDGIIISYFWDFGDGSDPISPDEVSERVGANPSHTYASPGTYSVSLTVTDDRGSTSQLTADVVID